MSELTATIIDVGWGDSIFLESVDAQGGLHYALIDSNDTQYQRSSAIFVKRYLERKEEALRQSGRSLPTPTFEWILLTHAHADHATGLKRLLSSYGTTHFWYPKSTSGAAYFSNLLSYARRSSKVSHHQSIDDTKVLPAFGDASLKILWPPMNHQYTNENNNSVVLTLELGSVSFVFTGDAEADVWDQISTQIPSNTQFFKIPHHGSDDAMFSAIGNTPWLNQIAGTTALLAVSSHVRPFNHPSPTTEQELDKRHPGLWYRTDEHHHIQVWTDGNRVEVKYTR